MFVSQLRIAAQSIRHAPGLESLDFVWNLLRKPYVKLLRRSSEKHGLSVTVGGFPMRMDPVFATERWERAEPESYRAFAEAIGNGDIVYDVGAHIGTYTVIALKLVGTSGRVVSYEPHDCTRQFLRRHLEWNDGVTRTVVRDVCCGSREGSAEFFAMPGKTEGGNSIIPGNYAESQSVKMTTLDAEVERLKMIPTLIKIDVEGAEYEVLRGAETVLRTHRPVVLISLHPPVLARLGVNEETIFAFFDSVNYSHDVIERDQELHVFAQPRPVHTSQSN